MTPCNLIKRYEPAEEPSAYNFKRWRQNVPPNRWYILPDYVVSHCLVFTFTALRTYLILLRFKMGTWSFPGIMRPERGAYHPPPSSAGLRMVESCTSACLLYQHKNVVGWPFYAVVYVCAFCNKWPSTPMVHTKHQTTNWERYILYATGGVHSTFQSTAAVFVGTLLHLHLLKGMEFHIGFTPHTYISLQ
jgi:hypothetical protein